MLRSIFLLEIIFFTTAQCGTEITISGEIVFEGGAPNSLPEPSVLTVDFEDVTYEDAPSITMGKFEMDLKDYRPDVPLRYSITTEISKEWAAYAVSAVINVGWIAEGDEWIRLGDYLSDTEHRVHIYPGQQEYTMDIRIVHYAR